MDTERITEPNTDENKRETVSSLLSSTSQESHSIDSAQESLLRGLDDGTDYATEAAAPDEQTNRSRASFETNTYKSDASSVTDVPHLAGQQPISDRHKRILHFTIPAERILNGWWLEIFCCWLSIVCLAVLIVFLEAYDNQPLPDWPSGITVNTVVALLSTVARTTFTIPVAEGLSQCKWNWFKEKPRPLKDLDLFDQASRGPWGSLSLLVRTKGRLVGIFSAILLVSSIGTSTLTQSAVTYPTRKVEQPEAAPAWSLHEFDFQKLESELGDDPLTKLREAVEQVRSTPVTTLIPFEEPRCPQSDCTWPRFSTLAICHRVTDITHALETDSREAGDRIHMTWTLPNGVNMTAHKKPAENNVGDPRSIEKAVVGSGPIVDESVYDEHVLNSSIFVYSSIYSRYDIEQFLGSRAAEVVFHWCVNTYDAAVENNVLSMQRNLSHTQFRHLNDSYFEMLSPADDNATYPVDETGSSKISEILREATTGSTFVSNKTRTGGERLQRAIDEIRNLENTMNQAEFGLFWKAVNDTAEKYETILLNTFLSRSNPNVNGVTWKSESYIRVRWPWLTVLIFQILLSIVLLVMVISETARSGVDIVKSSTLPSLFAINSKAKADMEERFEEGEPLVDKGHRRVVPWGIGGQLHKIDGKWQLRSVQN